MGIEVAIALAVATTVVSIDSAEKQRKAASQNRAAQLKSQSEQRASNASDAARERRQQIREERVRRARILQSAENTGTDGSSGEIGAIAGLNTQLQSNIGFNLGKLQTASNISIFQQDAANADYAFNKAQTDAQMANSIFGSAMKFTKF
jgi:hypothetical protein